MFAWDHSRTLRTFYGSCYINPTSTALSCSSDFAEDQYQCAPGCFRLEALLRLNPVSFNWKNESATSSPHSGLIAQDVQAVLPDLVSQGPDGYFTMNYAGLVTYIVKALQQFAAQLSELANTVASFADHFTTRELTFTRAQGDEIDTNTGKFRILCVEDLCVTRDQLAALLATAGQTGSNSWTQGSNALSTAAAPPTISINGNNPAHINIGDTYQDLGATAKDSTGHDLGVNYPQRRARF